MNFQMLLCRVGAGQLKGNSQASGLLYAPNASFSFAGGSNWYGAVIGKSLTDMGGAAIHYGPQIAEGGFIPGAWMLSSFTWKSINEEILSFVRVLGFEFGNHGWVGERVVSPERALGNIAQQTTHDFRAAVWAART